jgi:uncharacterized phage protein gp47/JayE
MPSNFDYTTRDFSTIRQELGRRASSALPEWNDRDSSDFMNVLIDLWAYMGDVMHFYIDRAAKESFLSTATQRESLLALANLYDYTPTGVSAARSTVTLFNSTGASVSVPAGTVFNGTSDGRSVSFYSLGDLVLPPESSGVVQAREGVEYVKESVASSSGTSVGNGSAGQQFTLPYQGVDLSTVRVYVSEGPLDEDRNPTDKEWTRVARLVNTSASDSVFSASNTADGSVVIRFGNGVNGRIPPVGLTIKASFSTCSGAIGNVAENTLNTLTAADLSRVTVVSSTKGSGGNNSESSESLRKAIPRAFRAQDRAVTLSDFADIALGVSGVAKARAEYTSNNTTGGSVSIYAVPYITDYTTLAGSVNTLAVEQTLRQEIVFTVNPVTMLGVSAVTVPAQIDLTTIYVGMQVMVKSAYLQNRVISAVREAVTALFDFDKIDFGQVLTVGEVYRAVLAVEGVDWVVVNEFNTTNDNSLLNGGRIPIDEYKLAHLADLSITPYGGVTV